MALNRFPLLVTLVVAFACRTSGAQQVSPVQVSPAEQSPAERTPAQTGGGARWGRATGFSTHARATEAPLISPGIRRNDDEEYKRQFEKCRRAFMELTALKEVAFPVLVEHLADKRPSIPFRNHFLGSTVGDACYWNVYFQLQDRPKDYSSYGYSRTGRDGKDHPKPYWEGTPFDDAGGLEKWLGKHQKLSYAEKQIECLSWLLRKEKAIGAADAESYFENILPLEIQILRRKQETGADVQQELVRLGKILAEKRAGEVPAELLPARKE